MCKRSRQIFETPSVQPKRRGPFCFVYLNYFDRRLISPTERRIASFPAISFKPGGLLASHLLH
jgi:hypothetical protein